MEEDIEETFGLLPETHKEYSQDKKYLISQSRMEGLGLNAVFS